MNLTELARRLRVDPELLRDKLPELGFSIGRRAIKIDPRVAQQIIDAWGEMKRRERFTEKVAEQKREAEARELRKNTPQVMKEVQLPPVLSVRDLAGKLEVPVPRLMQELMKNGILAALNERIDFDTAAVVSEDLGFKAVKEEKKANDGMDMSASEDRVRQAMEGEKVESLKPRPPVVVIMGHVDHGKTRLLDAIRSTNVMESEAGGITQHIGAYQVERHGRLLTFIDTPGHEAFTVMRSRGAKVADLAILVVAADDGIQPQTKEAINIIKSAKLPFIVALNKIDKADANPDRVKGQLSELELVPEDWGGKTVVVPISARAGTNIDQLLDMLLLTADVEQDRIRANPNRLAIGTVIESHMDPATGAAATVLVQNGTLKMGDVLGVGDVNYGRVRSMSDWEGKAVQTAPPSMPVQILGWRFAPAVGDIMEVPADPKSLRKLKSTEMSGRGTEDVAVIKHAQPVAEEEEGKPQQHVLNLIIRADVLGSLEAILGMLDTIKHEDVGVRVIGKGLGHITENDILSAEASKAIVMGFNARPMAAAAGLARDKNVDVREYSVIYRLFDDVLAELRKMLPSETIVTDLGSFEVLALFRKTDDGQIVGGKVKGEKLVVKAKLRVKRGESYVGEGEIAALQLGRSEIKEAHAGQECGLLFKGKVKLEVGDVLEGYLEEKKVRDLVIEGVSKR
jgi:translation initiation factor IF-2